jgi:hypothetical protein
MEYGYVCFAYTKNKWYDWCIAKLTRSQWSHAFITCPPMLNNEMAMEATRDGVTMCSFDERYRQDPSQIYQVFRFKIDQVAKNASIQNRIKELETLYGYLEYPWFAWRYLNSAFGRDIKSQNNWCQNGTEVCSQFVIEYISDCGCASLFNSFGKGSAAPQDVYEIVLAHPELFELIESK